MPSCLISAIDDSSKYVDPAIEQEQEDGKDIGIFVENRKHMVDRQADQRHRITYTNDTYKHKDKEVYLHKDM